LAPSLPAQEGSPRVGGRGSPFDDFGPIIPWRGLQTDPAKGVPDTFTWTVAFPGVLLNNTVGFAFYDPLTVGSSENFYWLGGPTSLWREVPGFGNVVANLGARVAAVPEPGSFILGATGIFGLLFARWRRRSN
jgi:hypothetical protein